MSRLLEQRARALTSTLRARVRHEAMVAAWHAVVAAEQKDEQR